MKTRVTILIGLLVFCNVSLYAQTGPTIREQLEGLNKYWKTVLYDDPILQETKQLTTDVDLITTHLLLVENYLRAKPVNLTEAQSRNRSLCLNILKAYRERGVYPINTHHAKRTPYFIDDYGTACAVGQLIISTGYEDLAKRISADNNYAYIEDMNYPELAAWGDSHGLLLTSLNGSNPLTAVFILLARTTAKEMFRAMVEVTVVLECLRPL